MKARKPREGVKVRKQERRRERERDVCFEVSVDMSTGQHAGHGQRQKGSTGAEKEAA